MRGLVIDTLKKEISKYLVVTESIIRLVELPANLVYFWSFISDRFLLVDIKYRIFHRYQAAR